MGVVFAATLPTEGSCLSKHDRRKAEQAEWSIWPSPVSVMTKIGIQGPLKKKETTLVAVAQLVGSSSHTPERLEVPFPPGHKPSWRLIPSWGVFGRPQMFFPFSSPFSLSLKAMKKYPLVKIQENKKEERNQ